MLYESISLVVFTDLHENLVILSLGFLTVQLTGGQVNRGLLECQGRGQNLKGKQMGKDQPTTTTARPTTQSL